MPAERWKLPERTRIAVNADGRRFALLPAHEVPAGYEVSEYVREDIYLNQRERLRRAIDDRDDTADLCRERLEVIDDLSKLAGRYAQALEQIAAIDPYAMPADETCPNREAQNWATLNGVVSWARAALAPATPDAQEGPGGMPYIDSPPGTAEPRHTDTQESNA